MNEQYVKELIIAVCVLLLPMALWAINRKGGDE
jgi:hypothetical protein